MKTLIADDMVSAVEELRDIMAGIDPNGEHTGVCTSNDALEFIKKNSVDVAFLDIEMPGINGIELARRIREYSHGITNIVFVTGHSEYAMEAHGLFASGYLLKPATEEAVRAVLENLRHPVDSCEERLLRVQCFGDFEVFAKGIPLQFKRSKAKEVLAYLIDRKGAVCTSGELMAVIWENKANTISQQSQMRNVVADLKHTLAAAGAEKVLIRRGNKIAVNCNLISCDYYDFLHGDLRAINKYRGEYMAQYSWAEMTGAWLLDQRHRIY